MYHVRIYLIARYDPNSRTSLTDPDGIGTNRTTQKVTVDPDSPWFPWPDKETCVIDILRHVPRSVFSDKENAIIHWALLSLGVKNVPSEHQMKDVGAFIQKLCGIQSIRHKGSLGHVYYTNDLAAILAQEMANPNVRPHLTFLPEDAGKHRSQVWQGKHWLRHMDADLLTPMVREHSQDFYILEPALAIVGSQSRVLMPHRWFTRGNEIWARAWIMDAPSSRPGWVVLEHQDIELPLSNFVVSFPEFVKTYEARRLSDPRSILGMFIVAHIRCLSDTDRSSLGVQLEPETVVQSWNKTDPMLGNPWRKKAHNHRVLALPLWLYCDDTSGNQSKKWNKHNSWLFTLGGLPRRLLHQEYSVHFLSTSNLAPPLEMLEGIEQQISECQSSGIWVWDCVLQESVLIIPSASTVLSILGDNPMQSEMACHIGMNGKMFCRMCTVEGDDIDEDDTNDHPSHPHPNPDGSASEGEGAATDSSAQTNNDIPNQAGQPPNKKRKRRTKGNESMQETVDRVTRFMRTPLPIHQRTRAKTLQELRGQLQTAENVGGFTAIKNRRTNTGVKDTHLEFFMTQLTDISKSRKIPRSEKEGRINTLLASFPDDDHKLSPVWLLKGVDPHRDTPVEVLHVILLGFVKYFWRDAIARISATDKEMLIARLSSFDTSGLDISPLSGHTLVKYAGSLTGRDFRAIAQAAPFVLHELGLPDEKLRAWAALSVLVSLVWTPEIDDIETYLPLLRSSIDYFLDCTCALTIRWFNKPKFHVVLHLPDHINNLGPAMLYATEGFESFNAVIRSHSIHSNRHAPSRDIARAMAQCSRVRHLLSGGYFLERGIDDHRAGRRGSKDTLTEVAESGRSPWLDQSKVPWSDPSLWRNIGPSPRKLLDIDNFGSRILHLDRFNTDFGSNLYSRNESAVNTISRLVAATTVRLATWVTAVNGDRGKLGSWVLWWDTESAHTPTRPNLGRVVEIVQIQEHSDAVLGHSQLVVVDEARIGDPHELYNMPQVTLLGRLKALVPKDLLGTINVQHNCRDLKCTVTRTRRTYQEKELATKLADEITHQPSQDYLLNTSQMRNSSLVQFFRAPAPTLDRRKIILDSVKVEIDAAKQRKKAPPAPKSRAQPANTQKTPTASSSSAIRPIHPHPVASSSRRLANEPLHNTPFDTDHHPLPLEPNVPPYVLPPPILGHLHSHPQTQHIQNTPGASTTYTYPQFRQFVPFTPSLFNPQNGRP
ncbi:uncharacterized protein STEHIDRAFT_66542 [Stereum hirsutum FP-91666 SS1]|uniref:uncharacterized protein n=1 Tax=Stereum hirsutum (strain FP-91666) TaxID=721885 RepID=UPI0004449AE9|nr:uncharacterized protein STEHIDRAFT_66542 [Stereum hirsutum FP-91666 SS1]EIM81338.1 hypothetical protein STEHIDRAFT_66542 [Stereum hirsutum FP-91666 SS1]